MNILVVKRTPEIKLVVIIEGFEPLACAQFLNLFALGGRGTKNSYKTELELLIRASKRLTECFGRFSYTTVSYWECPFSAVASGSSRM